MVSTEILDYYIVAEHCNEYTSWMRRKRVDRDSFFRTLSQDAVVNKSSRGVVSTTVGRRKTRLWQLWRANVFSDHVLVLDCDGLEQLIAAKHVLADRGLASAEIESSPEHYWVVCNVYDDIAAVCDLAQTIPGPDRAHITLCKSEHRISIGASPKHRGISPIFGDPSALTGKPLEWFLAFQAHWQSPEMRRLLIVQDTAASLRDGTLASKAADPAFAI